MGVNQTRLRIFSIGNLIFARINLKPAALKNFVFDWELGTENSVGLELPIKHTQKMLNEDAKHFHCFKMLDQLLGRLTTSFNTFEPIHATSFWYYCWKVFFIEAFVFDVMESSDVRSFTDSCYLKAVCHAFDWVIWTIPRTGNLNGC